MAQQFKFNILTGTNAQTKYDAITTKEPFTFYLLQTGIGYLGEKKLFDAASLENTEVTLTGKFFRAVASHVITQADLDNAKLSKPDGTAVGDAGILFTADNNETDDGDEHQYFVPVKIPNTVTTIDGDNPGNDVPTATAVVNYVTQILGNYVTFEIDGVPGSATADGGVCYPGIYSTDEVRIGTWIDGKPIYRKCFSTTAPSTKKQWTLVENSMINNIEHAISIYGSIYNPISLAYTPIGHYQDYGNNSIYNCSLCYAKEGNNIGGSSHPEGIHMWVDGTENLNGPIYIIIEYTKTTDNGGV